LLQAVDVTFAYGPGKAGLHGVSVDVPSGSLVGILGPNGSGKTTLLRLLGGMLTPSSGRIAIDGRDVSRLPRRSLAREIAVVPQETRLSFEYSVLEVVLMGRYPHLGAFELEGGDDLRIAREALAATGTLALENRAFPTLSGGEKQRVVIAGALAQSARLMLLDEPTAALDPGYQIEIATLLRRLNAERGVTMAVATHDLNLAAGLCQRLVLLRDGRVLAAGPTSEVLTRESVRALYDVEADVHYHEGAGHLTVVPLRRSRREG
jgi:iron complex transport system ATP-binding protein